MQNLYNEVGCLYLIDGFSPSEIAEYLEIDGQVIGRICEVLFYQFYGKIAGV